MTSLADIEVRVDLPVLTNETSPRSPVTPTPQVSAKQPSNIDEAHAKDDTKQQTQNQPDPQMYSKDFYSVERTLTNNGYRLLKCIGTTLQGSVWKAESAESVWKAKRQTRFTLTQNYVIKVTKRKLHERSMAQVDGREVKIQENIKKEASILRYLSRSRHKAPKSLAKFKAFVVDPSNYFLVMEDGGADFFKFVQECHELIDANKLDVCEWQRFCKLAFSQIVQLVAWMHGTMHVCHLDISLENLTIQDIKGWVDPDTDKVTFSDDFTIKMVDFGLAEKFGDVFRCKKFVGKTAYKCPEIYAKQIFDARAADCWSLGVVLFMMTIGGAPYSKPCKDDPYFTYIANGKLAELLSLWERSDMLSSAMLDLLERMLKVGGRRLKIEEVQMHPWLL